MTKAAGIAGSVVGVAATGVLILAAAISGVDGVWGLSWVGFPVVGSVLVRQPRSQRIGWLMVGIGACLAAAQIGTHTLTHVTSQFAAVELAVGFLGAVGWLLMIAVIVCFPSGKPATAWDRMVSRALLLTGSAILVAYGTAPAMQTTGQPNPWAVPALATYSSFMIGPGFAIAIALMAAAVLGLARRWRRSGEVERLQYRWLVMGAAFAAFSLFVINFGLVDLGTAALVIAVFSMNLIPAAIGVAVLRYRLYDIDRLISRTASYVIVTGLVLATYALVVTSVTRLLPDSSTLAVAAATLAAAALARPLLLRIQSAVDRRFNRPRYDAQQTVETFGGRLRDEVATDLVMADLRTVVAQTLTPTTVSVWLRDV